MTMQNTIVTQSKITKLIAEDMAFLSKAITAKMPQNRNTIEKTESTLHLYSLYAIKKPSKFGEIVMDFWEMTSDVIFGFVHSFVFLS